MSESWRIKTLFDNRSAKAFADTGLGVGATVVRAPRGTLEPTYFKKGETARILDLLGTPSPSYPDLLEALAYNSKYPMWISAPSKNGRYGGIVVGPSGSDPLTGNGLAAVPTLFTALTVTETLGTGDGSVQSFSKVLTQKSYYNNMSVDILQDGVLLNLTASDASTEIITTSPDVGSGSYIRSSGTFEFTFDTAPALGVVLEVRYTINVSTQYYFMLLNKCPKADHLAAVITMDSDEIFTLNLYDKDTVGNYTERSESPIKFSMDESAVDGYGKSLYIEQVLEDSDILIPVVNSDLAVTTFSDDIAQVDFSGGDRGDAVSGADLAAGYEYFKQSNRYATDVFFDATADAAIQTSFSTLRAGYQKYSRYILPLPNESSDDALETPLTVSNRGISFYWNWGLVNNIYSTLGNVWTPLTGEIAANHADIIVNAFGGAAPAWINENGYGGQLTMGRVLRMAYDPDEVALKALDDARINPVVMDSEYGLMIKSERTSINEISDYSSIGSSGVIDYIVKNIVKQVLPFQLVKLNDDAHRNMVRNKAIAIITPTTIPPRNFIKAFAVKCDDQNNGETVLQAEEFHLAVAIKITAKSRTIVFTVINTPQGAEVEEAFA